MQGASRVGTARMSADLSLFASVGAVARALSSSGCGDSRRGSRPRPAAHGGRPEAEHRTRCQPPRQGADSGSDEHVTRVVNARVHARTRHDRGCGPQGLPIRRQQIPDGNRERCRGRGVAGWERRRRRHPHSPLVRDPELIPVGTEACAGDLHRLVHHQGRSADSSESGERSTSPSSPTEEREQGGDPEPRLGVVCEAGQPPHGGVQQGCGEPRHPSVGGAVVAAESL